MHSSSNPFLPENISFNVNKDNSELEKEEGSGAWLPFQQQQQQKQQQQQPQQQQHNDKESFQNEGMMVESSGGSDGNEFTSGDRDLESTFEGSGVFANDVIDSEEENVSTTLEPFDSTKHNLELEATTLAIHLDEGFDDQTTSDVSYKSENVQEENSTVESTEAAETGEPYHLPLISESYPIHNIAFSIENESEKHSTDQSKDRETTPSRVEANESEIVESDTNVESSDVKTSQALEFLSKISEAVHSSGEEVGDPEFVLLRENESKDETTTNNIRYSIDEEVDHHLDQEVLVEIVPLDRPEIPVSNNESLYRFIFPTNDGNDEGGQAAMDRLKYNWIEEQVLVNERGVPKECSVHVEKVFLSFNFMAYEVL